MPYPGGLFWTAKLPQSSVHVDFPDAIATMEASDLQMADYHDIFNALANGPSVPATVSFDVDWGPALDRYQAADTAEDFTIKGWLTDSAMSWTASTEESNFSSLGEGNSVIALAVKQRNGIFFQ